MKGRKKLQVRNSYTPCGLYATYRGTCQRKYFTMALKYLRSEKKSRTSAKAT